MNTEVAEIAKEYLEKSTSTGKLSIKISVLPALKENEKSGLIEVTDKKLLARIDNVVPGIANIAANAGVAHQATQVLKAGGKIYRAILPPGVVLCKSKEIEGAVRGFGRNAKNINAQANFLPVDGVMRKAAALNVANAAMNVASMVVGQYYMSQITTELEGISESISQISDFQEAEYKSHVMALVAQVNLMAEFSCETLENDEICKEEITKITILEKESLELLGQASIMMEKISSTNNLDYVSYERKVKEADSWYKYQQILIEVYQQIEGLKFTFHKGMMSRKQCYALDSLYVNQIEQTKAALLKWHSIYTDKFEINISAEMRRRKGLDKALHALPSLFDEEHKYKTIHKNVVEMITKQTTVDTFKQNKEENDFFQEAITIIAKEGKVYYLPNKIENRGGNT